MLAIYNDNDEALPSVFRAETVFHLVQSIIIAARLPDQVRRIFSLDTTLRPAVDERALTEIGDVVFEERPKSLTGRASVIIAGMTLYPFLGEGHDYFGPILNRPLSLLWAFGRARQIVLLNEGRFSDAGPIRGRRNHIYYPSKWKLPFGYFVHSRNPCVVGAVFTETSAVPRPCLEPNIQEILIDVEAELSSPGSSARAALLSVFGHHISFNVSRFSSLVVLPFFDVLDDETCGRISAFALKHGLDRERTLFKLHPRTQVPSRRWQKPCYGLNVETGTYPIELLLLLGHEFERAYFIDTSTNLKKIAKEKLFVETL